MRAILLAAALLASLASHAQQPPPPAPDGEAIYRNICQGCHMADARGAEGAGHYPSLAGNPKLAANTYPAFVVLKGRNGMPSFGRMDDAAIAAVVNYVRTHFGNTYTDPVSPTDVRQMR